MESALAHAAFIKLEAEHLVALVVIPLRLGLRPTEQITVGVVLLDLGSPAEQRPLTDAQRAGQTQSVATGGVTGKGLSDFGSVPGPS